MKIRQGFVSNSSSSSFVIRGAKYDIDTIKQVFSLTGDGNDIQDQLYNDAKIKPLKVDGDRDYFTSPGDEYYENKHIIFGLNVLELNDGSVSELSDPDTHTDDAIKRKLKELGLPETDLKTYIQFISNDNW
jgi:hypothetical protein